jgi:hypothetical protein
MVCLAVLPLTGLVLEQAFELALHRHFGHDLPGDEERHAHEGGTDPLRRAPDLLPGPEALALASFAELAALPIPVRSADVAAVRPGGRRAAVPGADAGLSSLATGPPTPPPIA